MSDFIQVPTTAQVRSEMAKTRTRNLFDLKLGLTATRAEQIALNEFDRWHQEELRKAKEQAWEEGARSGYQDAHECTDTTNPYAKDAP